MKMKNIFSTLVFALCIQAQASTFVGNGGNAGDIELQVSKIVLEKTLKQIATDSTAAKNLCRCVGDMAEYPACKSLEKLTEEQANFCGEFVAERAGALFEILNREAQIQWTEQPLFVKENGASMPVDAITNYSNKSIYINKENYLRLASNDRNFLLGHEIFHLTSWKNQPLVDEQVVGPFKENIGGRKLLNAASAALVVYSIQKQITDEHNNDLSRSRREKRFWISLDLGGFNTKEELSTLYIPTKYKGGTLSFLYLLSPEWGAGLHLGSYTAKEDFLETITAKDEINTLALGVFYRYFPFNDLFSASGQSFGTVGLKYELLASQFELKEDPIKIEDEARASYLTFETRYYMPLYNGFWLQAGLSYNEPKYSYSQNIDAEYKKGRVLLNLGGSYAF